MTLPGVKMMQRRWSDGWEWSIDDSSLPGESWSTKRKTCFVATYSTTNYTWQGLGHVRFLLYILNLWLFS